MAESTQRNVIELIWKSIDQSSEVLKSMGKGVDSFGNSLDGVTSPVANLTTNLLKVEAGLLAIGAALGGVAIAKAIEFESAAADLNKVLDESDGSLEKFKDQAIAISDAFGVSSTDVLASAASFKEAGFTAEEAFKLVQNALTLTKISELDAAQASETLVSILKGFGSDVADVPRIMDIINEVTNKYATNTVELSDALARVSPIAKQTGFSFEETAGTLTLMLEVFRKSEFAATAFNTTMVRLVSDTKDVRTALALLGVSQTDSNGRMKDGAVILKEVQAAFQGLPETQKLNTAAMLAGTEQAAKMVKVFDNLDLGAKIVKDALAGVGKSVKEEFEKRMQATEVIVDRLKTGFENLAIVAGTKLLDAFGGVASSLTDVFNIARQLIAEGKLDAFFTAIAAPLENINSLLQDLAKNLPAAFALVDFSSIQREIEQLVTALGGIGDGIDLRTVEGLAKALQLVVDGTARFIAINRGLLEVLPGVLNAFTTLIETLLSIDPAWFKFGGTILASVTIINKVGGAITSLSGVLTGLGGLASSKGGPLLLFDQMLAKIGLLTKAGPGSILTLGILALKFGYDLGSSLNAGINKLTQMATGFDTLGAALQNLDEETGAGGWLDVLETGISKVGDALYYLDNGTVRPATESIQKNSQVSAEWANVIAGSSTAALALTEALGQQNDALDATTSKEKESLRAYVEKTQDVVRLTEALESYGNKAFNASVLAAKGFGVQKTEIVSMTGELLKVGDVYTFAGQKAEAGAEQTVSALEQSREAAEENRIKAEELRLEWAKLESQNREIVFKASAEIQVAQIEAQAAQVVAAFESINTAIESTGELIGSLVEQFAGISSGKTFDKEFIERLIKEEMELRKQAFELQKGLVETQKKYLDAATERLKNGDALITIKGDGLEPQLEAFMFKILEKIQIEASAEGQSFLLGLPNI